jgi:hypothetical protein
MGCNSFNGIDLGASRLVATLLIFTYLGQVVLCSAPQKLDRCIMIRTGPEGDAP